MRYFPNIIIKLGLEDPPEGKALFRRITPKQLRENSGDEPLAYLKKQAVLLFQKAFEDTDVNLACFNVSLMYKDMDGDYMIIHNPEDLTAALKEYAEAGKIKIIARVQDKPSAPNTASSSPSVHTSTQTTHTTTDHETLNVTDAVEHVVGAIASATIMAANQVTRSLRDIKRAERKIIQPIRVATVMRCSCKPNAAKKTAKSPPVDRKEEGKVEEKVSTATDEVLQTKSPPVDCKEDEKVEEKVSTDKVTPQPVEEVTATSATVDVEKEKNPTEDEESEKKPAAKSEEDCAIPETTNDEPLFIHGRHTCDGCLSTPIVGKRFHAIPDYDLCETCFKNYSGDRDFVEVELDQDRMFQDRWKTRWDQFRRKGCALVCNALPKCPPQTSASCPFPQSAAGNEFAHDLALEEAVRRSLDDLKKEPTEVEVMPNEFVLEEALRRSDEQAEAEEAAAVEKAIQMSMEEVNKPVASDTPMSARSLASKSSFAQDAAGCGDIANDLGEALDKIANEIDEMTLTLGRSDEEKEADDVDSYMEEESLKAIDDVSVDGEKGATIIEGSEPALTSKLSDAGSKNSWHVVDNDEDGEVLDANAALGRAAQMIGSALFNSDMERSAPTAPYESVATVSSIPTTVHLDRAELNALVPDQLERWALQLNQLHELGFLNDQVNVETIERLAAANIGVNSTDEVSVQQVIDEMMKDW